MSAIISHIASLIFYICPVQGCEENQFASAHWQV